jgi:ABC transporter DrrB family efflux protein
VIAIDAAAPTRQATVQGMTVLTDTLVVTRRNLRRIRRTPRLLAVSSIHPVLFLLLFRYVFGGAIHTHRLSYVNYLVPGLLVAITLFGSTTAVAMAGDLSGGMIDRFRSLPMARSAVLAGRCLADVTRSTFVVVILLAVGTLTGFRFHNGVLPAVAGIALILAFSFAFSWVFALVGLLVRDPQTAQLAAFLPVFPFMFASTVFVPLSSMPGWLRAFAIFQPVSVTVDSVRILAEGGSHLALFLPLSAIWMALFLGVFGTLAIRKYRRS